MKRLFLLVAIVAMVLPSCKKINEAIEGLDSRLDKLEQETIPSIDEQISAINTTLGNLDAMDKELKGYIDNLTATASSLQEQINATNTKIDEVKKALQKEIEDSNAENLAQLQTAKSEVLAQLATVKTELENELAQINATIDTLKAKDTELDNKIAELRSYVDNELGKTTDWVNATFATLEQYNSLVSEVATIKEQIKAINQSITDLETRLTTKINEDIANAVSTLNADIQQKVKDIIDAYTNAIKSAKEEITAAYTSAIQNAINALDVSLKAWVGEQLANYYTIAEVEAKITVVQTAITEGDATLQEELSKLKSQLETTATEITAAYKKAIEEAINTNNGVIDTKIANEISSVNQRITNEVATINAKIAEIESRLDNVEAKIAELLARIQSVSYIPTYDDGKATVKYNGNTSRVTLDFEVSPKDAVVELAKVWQSAVSVKAIYTQTRAVSFIDIPILTFEADAENGIISILATGETLSQEFFTGIQSASVRLDISDGNSSIVSNYIALVAKEVSAEELEDNLLPSIIPSNQIWYTTNDSNKIFPAEQSFGALIISNKYENGRGVITFDDNINIIKSRTFQSYTTLTSVTIPDGVTSIGDSTFSNCSALASVTIPESVASIGNSAFYNCNALTSITIPDGVTSIGDSTFSNCSALVSVTIPESVASIGNSAFYSCSALTRITIPDSVSSIGKYAFQSCYSLTGAKLGNNITHIERGMFQDCTSLTRVTIPNSITSIKDSAFLYCTSLERITIPDSVTSIESRAFYGCSKLLNIYCKNQQPFAIIYSIYEDADGNLLYEYSFPINPNMKIHVPTESVDMYINDDQWKNYSEYIVGYDF